MSRDMLTLHEIALKYAKKQPGIVDDLTEDAPVLKHILWQGSTHGMWNVAEKYTDVDGVGFVKPDTPLPTMQVSSDLVHTDLGILGGKMVVPSDRALSMGGVQKYVADRQSVILRDAGMTAEKQIIFDYWLRAAKKDGTLYDAKGTAKGWFILAVRFEKGVNCGLYDPAQFDTGRLLKISFTNDGAEHTIATGEYRGVVGYEVLYRGRFGYQILDPKRTVAAIVNIDETNKPTTAQIDDMIAQVRGTPGSTYLVMSPRAKIHGINPYKTENVQLANNDTDAKTRVETWNGISILTSYNIMDKIEHVTVG